MSKLSMKEINYVTYSQLGRILTLMGVFLSENKYLIDFFDLTSGRVIEIKTSRLKFNILSILYFFNL
ncbi:hypothetical protein BpHYR1_049874 [Brachionus plicatilis]|uniref:Uncharacterized protein n=1 Tax=Brachionus plicatilis TaxID=10195 RepID=A0A3M7PSW4_BRAPC|nr:hypothetical protein BpHYR1_049874 [Brachionus plicatilis]